MSFSLALGMIGTCTTAFSTANSIVLFSALLGMTGFHDVVFIENVRIPFADIVSAFMDTEFRSSF